MSDVKASESSWTYAKRASGGGQHELFFDVPLDKIEFYRKDDNGKWIRA
jgi:hypothetical protein